MGNAARERSVVIERIAVVVASKGRPAEIAQLLAALDRQSFKPSAIILSVTGEEDLPATLPEDVIRVLGSAGSSAQRNRGLEAVINQSDVVVFYDDDFLPSRHAIRGIKAFFETFPQMTGASGFVLKDGVTTGGLSYEEAQQTLDAFDQAPPAPLLHGDHLSGYGCNMAVRCAAIGAIRFDENLPLYGWQEDLDFAARVAATGPFVRTNAFAGVHRGVFKARTPGKRLGYSQMVNPAYLVRKGTMPWRKAGTLMLRNFAANAIKSLTPEPYIDRRGRLAGNLIGLADIMRGAADPMKVLTLSP
jgi:GT2 family glycosyltransferase